MHVEFGYCMREAVATVVAEHLGASVLKTKECERLIRRSFEQIEFPPTHVEFEMCSSACFELALLGRKHGVVEEPVWWAQRCTEEFLRRGWGSNFSLEAGASGHINATPGSHLRDEFFRVLSKEDEQRALRKGAIVIADDATAPLFFAQPFSWNVLRGRFLNSRGPEANNFFSHIDVHEGDPAMRMMVVCMMEDKELDSVPFLRGWCSRENVPRHLQQFLGDQQKFSALYQEHQSLSDPCTRRETLMGLVSHSTRLLGEELLSFRGYCLEAERLCRPDLVFGSLRRSVSHFYSVYNLPQSRHPVCGPKTGSEWESFSLRAKLLARIVASTLERMRFID